MTSAFFVFRYEQLYLTLHKKIIHKKSVLLLITDISQAAIIQCKKNFFFSFYI